ncbi:DegT/DnrJ/EryC1/StrS family aminotransferase [Thermopirellula anaerolimosa]
MRRFAADRFVMKAMSTMPLDYLLEESADRLASEGGSPAIARTLPTWPAFDEEEIAAAAAVLRSGRVNYWTGDQTRRFEEEFADAVGCRHAVALANGTVALEAALAALGVGPGDDVIVTCRSFVASASCVLLRGARPIFADVDRESQNISAETIAAALTPRTRAVIAVHLAGRPCDMDPIRELSRRHGLAVIEDCAQAHGARYRGRPVGSLGDLAAFSFCQDKILTTAGEGGMVTTSDADLFRRVWTFKDHGKNYEAVHRPAVGSQFRWLHDDLGTNARMTEFQGAVGRVVLRKLEAWVERRRRHAEILTEELSPLPCLRIPIPPPDVRHAYYKFYLFVRPERLRPDWNRDRILAALQAENVPCGTGACPEIYLEKLFRDRNLGPVERLPVARELGETALMLPVHPTLGEEDVRDMARALRKVLRHAAA